MLIIEAIFTDKNRIRTKWVGKINIISQTNQQIRFSEASSVGRLLKRARGQPVVKI